MTIQPPVTILRNNGKTIRPEDLPPEAWAIVMGKGEDHKLQDIYSKVSWVFRAMDILMNNMRLVPFIIENLAGDKIDDSTAYENKVGFLPHPRALFQLIEVALNVFGYAYLYRQANILGSKTISTRYMLPTSIQPDWRKDDSGKVLGLNGFKRRGAEELLKVEDVIYFWKPDPFVEFGPPASSALMSAAAEAGVILNLNAFASLYFERGAIRATILAVSGDPPEKEKQRIKSLWQRLMTGVKGLFGEMVINAESLKPIVVGGGLDDLADKNLTNEKREAIASAIGIPHSMLFSGASNYAVSQQDELNLYNQKIVPDCDFIEEIMNEQLLNPAGYRMRFTPEAMDIFQQDESDRAQAMNNFMDAFNKATSLEMVKALFKIFGYEVDDEAMGFIVAHFAEKQKRADAMAEQLKGSAQPGNTPPAATGNNGGAAGSAPPTQPGQPGQPATNPGGAAGNNGNNGGTGQPAKKNHLDLWQLKAIKAIKAGKSAAVPFESDEIPMALQGAIAGALEEAKDLATVEAIFDNAWIGYP